MMFVGKARMPIIYETISRWLKGGAKTSPAATRHTSDIIDVAFVVSAETFQDLVLQNAAFDWGESSLVASATLLI